MFKSGTEGEGVLYEILSDKFIIWISRLIIFFSIYDYYKK